MGFVSDFYICVRFDCSKKVEKHWHGLAIIRAVVNLPCFRRISGRCRQERQARRARQCILHTIESSSRHPALVYRPPLCHRGRLRHGETISRDIDTQHRPTDSQVAVDRHHNHDPNDRGLRDWSQTACCQFSVQHGPCERVEMVWWWLQFQTSRSHNITQHFARFVDARRQVDDVQYRQYLHQQARWCMGGLAVTRSIRSTKLLYAGLRWVTACREVNHLGM